MMQTLREWLRRLTWTFRGGRGDADLEEEVRAHLDMAAEDAQRRGAEPEEARRLAHIAVGGPAQAMEALRDQRGLPWLDDMVRDAAYGMRGLGRSKGFAATAVLSLALGIGANAGIFSLFDRVLLRPLNVAEPDRLVQIDWDWGGASIGVEYGAGSLLSYPLCRDLAQRDEIFDGVFCRHPIEVNLTTTGEAERVRGELVSGAYFDVLGIRPALGRLIGPDDDRQPDSHPVAVLSDGYWRTRFAAASDVVGRTIRVNNYPMTVVGVAPEGFSGVDLDAVPDIWIPAMMKRQLTPDWDGLTQRRIYWVHTFGRLRPGVTAPAARSRLEPWFRAMIEEEAQAEAFATIRDEQRRGFLTSTLDVIPASRGVSNLRGAFQRPLWVLMGGTLLLLLLTTLNVAGLLLARGAARTRELTTRMALGATRSRIARQLLVESLLITLGGGLLGLAMASLVSRALLLFVAEGANLTATLDRPLFAYALLTGIVTGALCGLAPILQMGRMPLSAALTDRSGAGRTGVRLRKLLVAGQIGFTLVLLVAAGLFVRTLVTLQAKGPGFATDGLVLFSVDPTAVGYDYQQSERTMRELFRRLETLPEVERLALANTQMLTGGTSTTTMTIGEERRITDRAVHFMRVTPGFFDTLGLRIVDGRDFDARDVRPPGTEPGPFRTVIVNDTFARRYFGDRSPVGARLARGTNPGVATDIEIVGVVREFSRRDLRDQEFEQAFFAYWDNQSDNGAFYARVRGNTGAAAASIRRVIAELLPAHPAPPVTTFDAQIAASLWSERALAALTTGFGLLALLISIVGTYGVMAFVANQRTQEIGLRLALGATWSTAAWVVIRDALAMIAAGALLALPAAWGLRRYVEGELFGVAATDAPTLAAAGGGLALVALGSAAIPAWRAALLPPMVALRDQPETMWETAHRTVGRAVRALVPAERGAVSPAALVTEFSGLVHHAASFAEAIRVALDTLRERIGASTAILLEREGDTYRDGTWSIPASGVLLNRLSHYSRPLPIAAGDVRTWRAWAETLRPQHLDEIDALERTGARVAIPLRTRSEMVGVILLGAPAGADRFAAADLAALSTAADLFALMLENVRLNTRALEQERLRRDLALAAEVQKRLLPPTTAAAAPVSVAAFTLPARSVGGDYYDVVDLPGNRLGVAIADVAGKGVAAALLMSVVQASLRVIASDPDIDCAQVAAKMNGFLCRSTAANSYATFFYAEIDPARGRLRYVNAGHNPPYLVRDAGAGADLVELSTGGMVLGLFPDVPYEHGEVVLRPGDLLIAFTDGVTEARRADGEEFGEERLQALVLEAVAWGPERLAALLEQRMREWSAGAEQHDDLTFLIAAINPQAAAI